MKAVAAHKEWYRSHGLVAHQIFSTRVVVRDPATHAQSYSDKEFVSFRVEPLSTQPEPKHDEAYDGFVKLYRDTSDIKQQYSICMPKVDLR